MTTFDILNENVQLESFCKSYNISPSVKETVVETADDEGLTKIPVVRLGSENQRLLQSAVWPLIPFWAGSEVPKFSTANARCESMTSKPSYRNAWKKAQRCLILPLDFTNGKLLKAKNVSNRGTFTTLNNPSWHLLVFGSAVGQRMAQCLCRARL